MSHTNQPTTQDIYYDVRVVRLAKSTAQTKIRDILKTMHQIHDSPQKPRGRYNLNLCLGHFDVMIIDQIPASENEPINPMYNVIEDYQKNRDLTGILESKLQKKRDRNEERARKNERTFSENGSYYPLYMLLQKPITGTAEWDEALTAFWNKECNYTIVMRLHQMPSRSKDFTPFREQLIQHLSDTFGTPGTETNQIQKTAATQLVLLQGASEPIECVFYDSMELGDVVAILKGNLLAQLLRVQRVVYEASAVNSAYSYCGIRFDLPEASKHPETEPMKKLQHSSLPFAESRYSVKNTHLASRFLRYKGFLVTGSVDALIQHPNYNEYKLLSDLRTIIDRTIDIQGRKLDFYDIFHDVVTSIGLRNHKALEPDHSLSINPALYPPIRLMRGFLNWLKKEYGNSNHPDGAMYAYSLERLVSSLNAMSENSVTDALAMLMYKGIKALIEQLEHYYLIATTARPAGRYTEWDRVGSYVLTALQAFLDEWTSATNEILHLESQLFQHPELIPVRVYIPAMILQFQLLIVEKAMEAVNALEGGPHPKDKGSYEYTPIMLPSSQQHTDTVAIFDPRREPDYQKKSPLCIHVPIHMLYHPYRISLILCHEIAHYCGNEIRHRETRNKAILDCISFYTATRMIQSLDLIDESEKDSYFAKKIKGQIPQCVKRAQRQFSRILSDKAESWYLSDVADALETHIPSLIQDPALINGIVYELLDGFGGIHQQLKICDSLQMEGYTTLQEDGRFCIEHLKCCLLELFRECFADIVMILLTGCSFEHYYLRVIHDEYLNLQPTQPEADEKEKALREQWGERHTNRMALVTLAINSLHQEKGLDLWFTKLTGECNASKYCTNMNEKISEWNAHKADRLLIWKNTYGDKNTDSYLLMGYEADKILRYLTECANDIYDRIHRDSGVPNEAVPEKTPYQQVTELKDLISMLMSGHIDWDKLQKQLHHSRIAYLDTIDIKTPPQHMQ